jgi:hypothetical protein
MKLMNLNRNKYNFKLNRLEIPESEWYVPAIHLYFNDDLTVS